MRHLFEDLEKLDERLLQLGETVAGAIQEATHSLCERLPELARDVIAGDDAIDREEVHVEEECIRILVIQQPVASDLRRVIAALKVDGDLERMADLAADIAGEVEEFSRLEDLVPFPTKLLAMANLTARMVRGCLNGFVRADGAAARHILSLEDEAERTHREIVADLKAMIRARPDRVDAGFHLLSAARYLERIAKHAANIAEDVIYMKEGSIVRHLHPTDMATSG